MYASWVSIRKGVSNEILHECRQILYLFFQFVDIERQDRFVVREHMLRRISRAVAFLAVGGVGIVAAELAILKKNTPRLPRAPGPVRGKINGKGKPLNVLIFGDSVACGVGCESNEQALSGAVAETLREKTKRPVVWTVLAESGYTAGDMKEKLLPKLRRRSKEQFDVVIISVGVNAVLSGHSPTQYKDELTSMLCELREIVGYRTSIVCMGMPPMASFPQISYLKPLNAIVGLYAGWINQASHAACKITNTAVCMDILIPGDGESNPEKYMAPDGFHPNFLACKFICEENKMVGVALEELQRRREKHHRC